jgi:integrase
MKEASRLVSPTGLRALTYRTLIGLLAATGLRPGEALALDKSDVDLNNGILSIRQSKFGKSRFVPLADSTRAALVNYARRRDKLCLQPRSEAFLVSERGQRLQGCAARRTFARISWQLEYDRRREAGAVAAGPGFRIFATVSQRGS